MTFTYVNSYKYIYIKYKIGLFTILYNVLLVNNYKCVLMMIHFSASWQRHQTRQMWFVPQLYGFWYNFDSFVMSPPLLYFLFFLCIATTTPWLGRAWYVASPASRSDWEQLASLLAERNQPRSADSRVAKLQWDVWGRRQAQDALYRRYVRTARQLKGS